MTINNKLHINDYVEYLDIKNMLISIDEVTRNQLEQCIKQNFIVGNRLRIIVLSFPLSDGMAKIKEKIESFIASLKCINNFKHFDYLFLLDTLNDDEDDLGYVYLLTTNYFNIDRNLGYSNSSLWHDFGYTEALDIETGMDIMMGIYDDTMALAKLIEYTEWIFCNHNFNSHLINASHNKTAKLTNCI